MQLKSTHRLSPPAALATKDPAAIALGAEHTRLHPDPRGAPDLTPIEVGEVWENPVTGERGTILELPYENAEGRASVELTALAGARVAGEHRHPGLIERFTVLEGELTLKRDGQTNALREGESAEITPGTWHDWWNAGDRNARVRVEITPGERFAHMIETMFGLARLGHVNAKGMPRPLQLALIAREFSDVIVFRSPPAAVQRAIFGALAPIAHGRGYRSTYPQISRTVLAPRHERAVTPQPDGAEILEGRGLRIRRAEDSTDEVSRAHVAGAKGTNAGPVHIHLPQEERFIVHTGELQVRRGRDRITVGPGQDIRIPAKTPHTFEAQTDSTFTTEFRPALRVEDFFRDLFVLPTDRHGNPRMGDAARLMLAYPDEFLYLPF